MRLRVTGDKRGGVSRVEPSLHRKSDSKKCRLTLGEYPALSLSEACHLASRYRNEAWEGKDPATERRKAKEAPTFESLALLWLERHAKVKKRSWAEDERMMRTNLLPALGAKKPESIAKSDVVATIHKIMDRGACYQANRNLALLRTIFNWAMDHDFVETNPALRIPRPAEEIERARSLAEPEIRQFSPRSPASMYRPVQIALELALLTGARISEILEARKSEFDLTQSLWTIPGRRPLPRAKKPEGGTKNKLDHVLPLGDLTRARIEEAFVFSKDSEWLFPSPKGASCEPVGEKAASRAWRRVRGVLGLDDVHVHDFRRTYGTVAASLGYNDFEVGLCLNHKTVRGKVTSIYNRFQYLPEKKRLIADVDRYFASLMPKGQRRKGR